MSRGASPLYMSLFEQKVSDIQHPGEQPNSETGEQQHARTPAPGPYSGIKLINLLRTEVARQQ